VNDPSHNRGGCMLVAASPCASLRTNQGGNPHQAAAGNNRTRDWIAHPVNHDDVSSESKSS
jgi:hypothetical protein